MSPLVIILLLMLDSDPLCSMFSSLSEYLSCCRETFSLFKAAEELLPTQKKQKVQLLDNATETVSKVHSIPKVDEKPFELTPFGVACAFEAITGYAYRYPIAEQPAGKNCCPLVSMNETSFLEWMKTYAEVDTELVGGNTSGKLMSASASQERSHTVEELPFRGSSITAWEMFEAIAGTKGFVTLEDLEAMEGSPLFSGIDVEKIVEQSGHFNSTKNMTSTDFINNTIVRRRNGIASHLFHSLSIQGADRVGFVALKPFLSLPAAINEAL